MFTNRRFLSKKFLLLIISLIILIIIVILCFLIFSYTRAGKKSFKSTETLNKEAQVNLKKYKGNFNHDQVERAFLVINNKSLSETERYQALKNLSFYFSVAYAASHEPELREYAINIRIYAKENFPELYEEGIFNVGCADPECGEKPDDEIKQIQKEINEAGIPIQFLNTINKNLEQAIFIPNEQKDDKKYGFGLAIEQLRLENNPKASAAAERLANYMKKKYGFKLIKDL